MEKHPKPKYLIPFFTILLLTVCASIFVYYHPLSVDNLRMLHVSVRNFAAIHPALTLLLFMSVYILYALLSLPGIFVFSLLAGCLFSQPFSTLYVTFAATVGASLLFLAARTAFGQFFFHRAGRFLDKMEQGFRENAASYLLFLRLIPLFPFGIVNIAGAFFNVPFRTFAWTTFLGMIPSVFIYTQAGRGLALLLHSSDPLNPAHLFNPFLIGALVGLALLALLPIFFRKLNRN